MVDKEINGDGVLDSNSSSSTSTTPTTTTNNNNTTTTITEDERIIQKRLFKENWKNELVPGEKVNIISAYWLRQWKNYVRFEDNSPKSSFLSDVSHVTSNGITNLKLSAEFEIPRPETINNKDLIVRDDSEGVPILAENKIEGDDYEIINPKVWELLLSWYKGGPEIQRKVVVLGLKNDKYVEVRPILLKIKCLNNQQPSPPLLSVNGQSVNNKNNSNSSNTGSGYEFIIQKSRKETLNEVRDFIAKKELVDSNKVVLYKLPSDKKVSKQKLLKKYSSSLEDLKFEATTILSFEVQGEQPKSFISKIGKKLTDMTNHRKKEGKKDSNPPSPTPPHHQPQSQPSNTPNSIVPSKNEDNSSSTSTTTTTTTSQQIIMHKGVCGLTNLGNTCFMNSSLQCLAHTIPFVEYFLTGRYLSEINKVNPLGMKGQIADNFGKLMKDMWSGQTVVSPKNLKWNIGKYAPQFSGMSQQDSQELLSFLLDGLHEDLNRVLKKPYIEEKEDSKEQREDSIVAAEQWDTYLKRNQSIVVDLFQGQYKSTLVCNKCSKVSVTFDTFMYVTLPIPVPTERVFEILLFRCKPMGSVGPDPNGVYCLNNAMDPVRYCLKLNKREYIQSLRIELSKQCGIDTPCLALAEIYSNRINTFLSDQRNLSFMKDRDITIAYELPVAGDDVSRLHVMHRKKNQLFLLPYVLLVRFGEITCKEIYRMVWERVGHRVKRGWKSELLRQRSKESLSTHNNTTNNSNNSNNNSNCGSSSGNNSQENSEKDSPVSSPDGSQFGTEEDDASSITDDELDEAIYPFVLKSTNGYGNNCDRCLNHCSGCVIPCDSRVLKEIFKTPKFWSEGCSNVTIDWRPEILKYLCDGDDSPFVKEDASSIAIRADIRAGINLNDCFTLFTKNEKLGPSDTWFCPRCKEHNEGNKKLEIWSVPRILIIHLKRFQFHHRHEKITAFVDFPLDNFDLSKWVLNQTDVPPIYQLYAVSNHMGGVGAGHYTAYVKNQLRDKWFLISDSSYHTVDESNVKSSEAYVLFYELKTNK